MRIISLASRSLVFTLLFTIVIVTALSIYIFELQKKYADRVYPNVYANSINLGGMSREDIQKVYEKKNAELQKTQINIIYKDTTATFSGTTLNLSYDTKAIAEHAMLIGRSPHVPSALIQTISSFFHLHSYTFNYKPSFNLNPITDYFTDLEDTYNVDPQDALFEFKNNKVTSFKVEKPGVKITSKKALADINEYLTQKAETVRIATFTVSSESIKPDITIAKINSFGIEEKIGEGQSDYSHSSPEREYNLTHAAKKLNGIMIAPNEVFSFNKAIGDISQATGFKPGYIIKEGRTVLGDGGGICQDSTTMFRAALNTGLPIVERQAHAYRVRYYENDRKPGFDATVFAPSVDFKFKNDTGSYILIQTTVNPKTKILLVEFYGKSDGRTVELSDAQVYGQTPAPAPLYQDDPSLPSGVTKQVDFPASGAKSMFTYKVKSATGEILQDKTFYSTYRPWQAVYLVGRG